LNKGIVRSLVRARFSRYGYE